MQFKFTKKSSRGFTLLEILLVVGIISLLAGIVIIAVNPSKQLATVRNTERKSDIKQLYSAINQYYISTGRYPSTLSTTLTEVCDTDNLPGPQNTVDCGTLVDLSILVPTYITAIPIDPQGPDLTLNPLINTAYAAENGTGYYVMKNTINKIVVVSQRAELGSLIAIGTSTNPFGGTTPPDEDPVFYTLTYDANGGSDAPTSPDIEEGSTITLSATEPTRTGYTFLNWNTDVMGNGASYDSGDLFTMSTSADITLYAQWSVNQYTLTFNTDGGSSISSITQDYGTTITSPADPTRSGYTFVEWSPAIPGDMPASNETHTAVWEAVVTCTATGGTVTTIGGYEIHTFTTVGNSTFNVTNGTCDLDVLVVAGGGGAGFPAWQAGWAGGGGAGGLIFTENYLVANGNYTVTVGGGGLRAGGATTKGANGSNSSFHDLIAIGGGGGGSTSNSAGNSGGSGGGASGRVNTSSVSGGLGTQTSQSGNSGLFGFGNNGGNSYSSGGGGGGGAEGTTLNIIGGVGKEVFGVVYAAGGNSNWVGSDGAVNSGNGGNAPPGNSGRTGGSGGSGIVIVRYEI